MCHQSHPQHAEDQDQPLSHVGDPHRSAGTGPCGTRPARPSIDAWHQLPSQLALHPQVTATPEAIAAIVQADLLLIGPGSFMMQPAASAVVTRDSLGNPAKPGATALYPQSGGRAGTQWSTDPGRTAGGLTRLIGRTPDGVLTQETGYAV